MRDITPEEKAYFVEANERENRKAVRETGAALPALYRYQTIEVDAR